MSDVMTDELTLKEWGEFLNSASEQVFCSFKISEAEELRKSLQGMKASAFMALRKDLILFAIDSITNPDKYKEKTIDNLIIKLISVQLGMHISALVISLQDSDVLVPPRFRCLHRELLHASLLVFFLPSTSFDVSDAESLWPLGGRSPFVN